MKKAVTVAAIAIMVWITSCGIESTSHEKGQNTKQSYTQIDLLTDFTDTIDTVTEETETTDSDIDNVIYGDDNCRNDNDCALCKRCNITTHKCDFMPAGNKSKECSGSRWQCDGQGGCECTSHFKGEFCEICKEGFVGENCDQCDKWHYGQNCEPCSCPNEENNICKEGKMGTGFCSYCGDPNRWGSNCEHIGYCANGKVDINTGKCAICYNGYSGSDCTIKNDCQYGEGDFGIEGTGKCRTCTNHGDISTNCRTCLGHRVRKNGFCQCAQGWQGDDCEESVCFKDGTKEQLENGTCVCNIPYEGQYCDVCRSTIWGMTMEETLISDRWGVLDSKDCRYIQVKDKRYLNSIGNYITFIGYFNASSQSIFIFTVPVISEEGETKYKITWEEAQNVCPKQWYVPSITEFSEELKEMLAKKMPYDTKFWFADENEEDQTKAISVQYKTGLPLNHPEKYIISYAPKSQLKASVCAVKLFNH